MNGERFGVQHATHGCEFDHLLDQKHLLFHDKLSSDVFICSGEKERELRGKRFFDVMHMVFKEPMK